MTTEATNADLNDATEILTDGGEQLPEMGTEAFEAPGSLFDETVPELNEDGTPVEEPSGEDEPTTDSPDSTDGSEPADAEKADDSGGEENRQDASDEQKPDEQSEDKPDEKPAQETPWPEDKAPPKGLVSIKALHERSAKVQELRQNLSESEQRVAELEAALKSAPKEKVPEFKEMSDEELDTLYEEDPVAFAKYQRDWTRHQNAVQARQRADTQAQAAEKTAENRRITTVRQSLQRMSETVPGIHDETSEINQQLTEFATGNGFDIDTLAVMTNPGTMVIAPGAKEPMVLGDGAVQLVSMVHQLHQKLSANDPDTIRQGIETQLAEKIRADVTKELMDKFKNSTDGRVSLSDVPTAGSDETDSGEWEPLDESGLRQLTAKQRELYRQGRPYR